MPHVFISYLHENKTDVQRLCDDLTRNGVEVWLDRNNIQPGMRWKGAIRKGIKEGEYFIACFSSEYNERDKNYMNEELVLAIDELRKYSTNRVWFIPVLLSNCSIPDRNIGGGESLIDFQWISLQNDWDAGVQRILNIIQP
jgi:hypothetical protein